MIVQVNEHCDAIAVELLNVKGWLDVHRPGETTDPTAKIEPNRGEPRRVPPDALVSDGGNSTSTIGEQTAGTSTHRKHTEAFE